MYNVLFMIIYYSVCKLAEKDKDEQQDSNLIYWFIGLTTLMIILTSMHFAINTIAIFTASRKLHEKMVWSLLRAKMEFFDSNSIGSILTRFTKDISGLDDFLPLFTFVFWRLFILSICGLIMITIAAPFVIILVIIAAILIYATRRHNYLPAQTLEWLESETRGPMNTRFSSIMDGLISIRAYK